MARRAKYFGGLRRPDRCVTFNGDPVRLLDRPQAGGDRVPVGDGLAVASAVGAVGKALAELLDLANMGFPLLGVSGDGVEAI